MYNITNLSFLYRFAISYYITAPGLIFIYDGKDDDVKSLTDKPYQHKAEPPIESTDLILVVHINN